MATDYIGAGFGFPLGFDQQGGMAMAGGTDRIEQSIRIILSTAPGERVMRPDFGCAVWDFVFAPITRATLSQMADATAEALKRWEPRITVQEIVADADPDDDARVLISVKYQVAPTNDQRNLVYPFYVIPREEEAS